MKEAPLNIVSDTASPQTGSPSSSVNRLEALRAHFERLWLEDPERFNPNRSVIERERIDRTWQLLKPLLHSSTLKVLDLGFGWGELTKRLHASGATVDGAEIASNAIKHFQQDNGPPVRLLRTTAPETTLQDSHYDIVVCTDLIAELHPHDQRLLISELYRLTTPEGHIVCSTPLDINTENALQHFQKLIETELTPIEWSLSYHTYYIRLCRFLNKPQQVIEARYDANQRRIILERCSRGRCWWKRLQWSQPLYSLWWLMSKVTTPVLKRLQQSQSMLLHFEKLCKTLNPEEGVSHACIVASRKSLMDSGEIAPSTMNPTRQRLRERVWE